MLHIDEMGEEFLKFLGIVVTGYFPRSSNKLACAANIFLHHHRQLQIATQS